MRLIRFLSYWFCAISFAAATASAETWKIASPEWPPYAGAHLPENGRAIEKLRSILSNAGITLVVEFMPWSRAQTIAASAGYVGYFPAREQDVCEEFATTHPVTFSKVGVVKREETTLEWSGLDVLFENYRIGFVASHVYPPEIQRQIYLHYQPEDGTVNEEDLARILAAGRVEAALADPEVLFHITKRLSLNGIDPNPRVLERLPLVLALVKSEGYERRMNLLNELLKNNPAR